MQVMTALQPMENYLKVTQVVKHYLEPHCAQGGLFYISSLQKVIFGSSDCYCVLQLLRLLQSVVPLHATRDITVLSIILIIITSYYDS